jgi:hypothetical protein
VRAWIGRGAIVEGGAGRGALRKLADIIVGLYLEEHGSKSR